MLCQFATPHSIRLVSGSVHRVFRSTLTALALSVGVALIGTSVSATAAQPLSPKAVVDLAKGKATAGAVCIACHAADGNSVTPENPILAGQHAAYLEKQLHNFKVKPGATVAERNNAIMAGFASILSDEDIRNVSAFYASQKISPASPKRKDLLALGEQIYRVGSAERGVPACVGCHSPNGAGIPVQYPRLAGQHAAYTESQLVAFRSGLRNNSAQMMTISGKMSDREIAAVSEYIAGLR
jgi:cytochrome c553